VAEKSRAISGRKAAAPTGIVSGLVGAILGVFAAVVGAIAGAFGSVLGSLFHPVAVIKPIPILLVILIVILIIRSNNKAIK
jgi:ABC-type microcin C transport system permease subunit YejE